MKTNTKIILSINLLLNVSFPAPVSRTPQRAPAHVVSQRGTTARPSTAHAAPIAPGIKLMPTTAPVLNLNNSTNTPQTNQGNALAQTNQGNALAQTNQGNALTQTNTAYVNPNAISATVAAGTGTYSNALVNQLYNDFNGDLQRLKMKSQSLGNEIKSNDAALSPLISSIFTYFTPKTSK